MLEGVSVRVRPSGSPFCSGRCVLAHTPFQIRQIRPADSPVRVSGGSRGLAVGAGAETNDDPFVAIVLQEDDGVRDRRFIELHILRGVELPVVAALLRMPFGAARTCWSRLRIVTVSRVLRAMRSELAERDWQLLAAIAGARMTFEEAAATVGLNVAEAAARFEVVLSGPVRAVLGPAAALWLRRCVQ